MDEDYVVRIPFTATGVVEVRVPAPTVSEGVDEQERRRLAVDAAHELAIGESAVVTFDPDSVENDWVSVTTVSGP